MGGGTHRGSTRTDLRESMRRGRTVWVTAPGLRMTRPYTGTRRMTATLSTEINGPLIGSSAVRVVFPHTYARCRTRGCFFDHIFRSRPLSNGMCPGTDV